jgi:hypothetical protein
MGWASCGGVGRCRMRLHACFGHCVTVGVIGWKRRPMDEAGDWAAASGLDAGQPLGEPGAHDRDAETQAILRSCEALVATHPELKRKGATMPYTSINGHMFSFLTPEGTLALRLPAAERTDFMETYGTAPVEQHGAVLKEYVAVPADLLERLAERKPYSTSAAST